MTRQQALTIADEMFDGFYPRNWPVPDPEMRKWVIDVMVACLLSGERHGHKKALADAAAGGGQNSADEGE